MASNCEIGRPAACLDATLLANARADGLREVEPRRRFRNQSGLQDFASLLFHRPAVTGCAYAQPRFHCVIQAAYCDARHTAIVALQSLVPGTRVVFRLASLCIRC